MLLKSHGSHRPKRGKKKKKSESAHPADLNEMSKWWMMEFVFVKLVEMPSNSCAIWLSVASLDTQAPFTEVHIAVFSNNAVHAVECV